MAWKRSSVRIRYAPPIQRNYEKSVSTTAPIIHAGDGSSALADTQSTRDLIANKATGNIWLLVIGGVTFAIATLVLVTRLVKRG